MDGGGRGAGPGRPAETAKETGRRCGPGRSHGGRGRERRRLDRRCLPCCRPAPCSVFGSDLAKGKAVYGGSCFVCHATGAAGAPKLGDNALWAPRIAQGMAVLEANALNGKGAMPPKGGRMDISDEDVKAAVAYMVSGSQ